jgi:hypothetical protein
VVGAGAYGCRVERDLGAGDTIHGPGFADPLSPSFHGGFLASHTFPLGQCRRCHGDDYRGGSSQSSCVKTGCHTEGVEACDTCHEAKPTTGGHPYHALSCTECHPGHDDARAADHPDGKVEILFGTLASTGGATPTFDPGSVTCTGSYCHEGKAATWQFGKLTCDGCHDDPPPSHGRFATSSTDCATCHGSMATHVDGKLDLVPLACDACHGHGSDGAPPPGLGGVATAPGVGAHARHLDPTLPDRIGQVARCDACHTVPKTVTDPGHLDGAAPADVTLGNQESYDPTTRTCLVACHFDRDPGPDWDDASGKARACDGCHAMPPPKTRNGVTHPPAAPSLSACLVCHKFDPSTHVDGKVDFQ